MTLPVLVRVGSTGELAPALDGLGLGPPRPALVLIGGAGGLDDDAARKLEVLFAEVLVPVISRVRAVAIDGGTDSGVMQLLGRARAGAEFPLVGVAAQGTVVLPGTPPGREDAAPLEPHHSHVLLVPGSDWGDESAWLARVATILAGPAPSVTILINGGEITFVDARHSLAAGRPVLVVGGTGRTADRIAAAVHGETGDSPAAELAASPLVHVAPLTDIGAVRDSLNSLLTASI